jgi:hypothetical protein
VQWKLNSGGHFLATADNTYDIGANGANRPRAIYLANTGDAVVSAGDIRIANGKQFYWASSGGIGSQSDGVFQLRDNAGTSFGRLQFGGTTSSFPALKRSSTSLQVRLADDSADAPFTSGRATIDTLTIGLGGQTSVSSNTALGTSALNSASLTGSANTAVGYQALLLATGGSNTAVGSDAMASTTSGGRNVAVGTQALQNHTTGFDIVAVGRFAGINNSTASRGVYVGAEAGRYFNTSNNVAVGYEALRGSTTVANNTGTNLTAVGYQALVSNTSGAANSAMGYAALNANTTGTDLAAVGQAALLYNTTGSNNSAVGVNALFENTTGSNSTAVGRQAAERFVANSNTALGYRALRGGDATPANNTGTNNIAIGFQAGDAITTGSTNIVIGHDIDVDSPTANNQINVGGVYFHDRLLYTERADPAAPAANQAVVYARDNGSGKTQLCVRFNTGAVQVLATEP